MTHTVCLLLRLLPSLRRYIAVATSDAYRAGYADGYSDGYLAGWQDCERTHADDDYGPGHRVYTSDGF